MADIRAKYYVKLLCHFTCADHDVTRYRYWCYSNTNNSKKYKHPLTHWRSLDHKIKNKNSIRTQNYPIDMEFEYITRLIHSRGTPWINKQFEENDKLYNKLCEICGQLCTNTPNLYRHMKSNTASVEICQCTWCKRLYVSALGARDFMPANILYKDMLGKLPVW